jgi:hypothetical protein
LLGARLLSNAAPQLRDRYLAIPGSSDPKGVDDRQELVKLLVAPCCARSGMVDRRYRTPATWSLCHWHDYWIFVFVAPKLVSEWMRSVCRCEAKLVRTDDRRSDPLNRFLEQVACCKTVDLTTAGPFTDECVCLQSLKGHVHCALRNGSD